MRRRGFTLIELLVVIAIIAILAAILFPVFAKAREKARQSSCSSNVKQLVLGMIQYVGDYDQRYPYSLPGCQASNQQGSPWWASIGPYVKNGQLYECPSANFEYNNNAGGCGGGHCAQRVSGQKGLNYGYSIAIGSGTCNDGNRGSCGMVQGKESALVAPAESFVVGDSARANIGGGLWAGGAGCAGTFTPDGICAPIVMSNRLAGCAHGICGFGGSFGQRLAALGTSSDSTSRHNGGNNIGFADGHVKWFKAENTVAKTLNGPIRFNGYELYTIN